MEEAFLIMLMALKDAVNARPFVNQLRAVCQSAGLWKKNNNNNK